MLLRLVSESLTKFFPTLFSNILYCRCRALVTPPDNPNFNGYKFDTVTGIVEDEAKTKIFVVYENGRAYPEYLVR